MFQERIIGPSDLRITYVGGAFFAPELEVGLDEVDSRVNVERPFRAIELDADIRETLGRTMETLGLEFGTIDMKVHVDGAPVFLEVNPQGRLLYVEIKTGLPISAALANLLLSIHARNAVRPRTE